MAWYFVALIVLGGIVALVGISTLIQFFYTRYMIHKSFVRSARGFDDVEKMSLKLLSKNFIAMLGELRKKGNFLKDVPFENVEITSFDNLKLFGRLYRNNNSKITVICCHGFHGKSTDWITVFDFLSKRYNLLLIDQRTHGQSQGEVIGFGYPESRDVVGWATKISEILPDNDIVLYGVSMGGATVMTTLDLAMPKSVKCVIEDCGYIDGKEQMRHMMKDVYKLPSFPVANFINYWFKKFNGFDLDYNCAKLALPNAKRPCLFIHGKDDAYVPFEFAELAFELCSSPKEHYWVDGAGHGGAYLENPKEYEKRFSTFINKYCSTDKNKP